MVKNLAPLLLTMVLSGTAVSAEPDFYINFSTCKNLVAPMSHAKEPLRLIKGDPVLLACAKKGDRVTCQLEFEEGKHGIKGNIAEYRVTIDSPPFLHFQLIQGNEYIAVNTTEHVAVKNSLMLDTTFAGSKVCHGLYMTSFEFKNQNSMK